MPTEAGEGLVEWVAYGSSARGSSRFGPFPRFGRSSLPPALLASPQLTGLDQRIGLRASSPRRLVRGRVLVESPAGPAYAGLERLAKLYPGNSRCPGGSGSSLDLRIGSCGSM